MAIAEQELGSILYAELSITDFGNPKSSRVEYPVPKWQAIEATKELAGKEIIHINNQTDLEIRKAISFLVERIKDGHLDELIKAQITDEVYSLYYKFDAVVYEIKYREVE